MLGYAHLRTALPWERSFGGSATEVCGGTGRLLGGALLGRNVAAYHLKKREDWIGWTKSAPARSRDAQASREQQVFYF